MKQLSIAVLVFVGAQLCSAQSLPGDAAQVHSQIYTYGMLNGRGWKIIPTDTKMWYLLGISEGMIRGSATEFSTNYQPVGLNGGEVRDAVDRFFAEPENLLINVVDALHIIAMKVKGSPQQRIDDELSAFRMVAAGAPERKQ